ncbi:MAG: hypothetical protein M1835_007036 [Candelina submexicana]|nr:MAG: hypothetical protein M1835_007036 [Candelina submexicana]
MDLSTEEEGSSRTSSDEESHEGEGEGEGGQVAREQEPSTNSESTTSSRSPSPRSPSPSDSAQSSASDEDKQSSKRKPHRPPTAASTNKRRKKSSYSDAYRELLNETIEQAASRSVPFEDQAPYSSQIGVSFWTIQEKETLFNHLGLFGRDDIGGLAAAIKTKSEMEVRVYLQLLQEGLFEHNYREIRNYLLASGDFPAAHELSSRCCKALDQAADSLARRENNYDQRMEQKKWQDLWLLTDETSDWVEDCLDEGVAGETELQEALPAATLLRLGTWLELSERIFMNSASSNEEDNWHYVARKEQTPSIYATAFSDFHTLAVSLIKRLVQSTLFCAMSRLRAMDSGTFNIKAHVRKRDVDAAVRILGLKANSNDFWIGAARRCKLDIYEKLLVKKIRKGLVQPLTYEEVERTLRNPDKHLGTDKTRSTVKERSPRSQLAQKAASTDSDTDHNLTQPQAKELAQRSSSPASSIKSESSNTTDSTNAEEEYLDAIDKEASSLEEQRLWAMLKRNPPTDVKPEEVEIPEAPAHRRKEKEDLVDWRDRIEFQSEWEVFHKPVPRSRWVRSKSEVEQSVEDEAN